MGKPLYTQHEEYVAKVLGGSLTCSSGRKFYDKADVRVGHCQDEDSLLLDAKCTQQDRYRLTYAVWHKLALEAGMVSRTPALPIRFLDENGKVVRDLIVVPQGLARKCANVTISPLVLSGRTIMPDDSSGVPFKLTGGYAPPVSLVLLDLDEFVESRSQ